MMDHNKIEQAREEILGTLYRAPGRFRKCDFYTLMNHSGELSADVVGGWADGVFYYYKAAAAGKNAWIAIIPAVGLCFTRGRTREGAQIAAFNCISALQEKIQVANDDDKIWTYYSLIKAEPALNMPDCYDDVRPKELRYQVVVWADECGSDEMMDFNRLNDAIADARRYADEWSYAAVYDRRRKRALVIFGDVSTPVFSDFVEVSAYSGK